MSNYFVSHYHNHAPHTEVSGEVDGACSILVTRAVRAESGFLHPRTIFNALGQCGIERATEQAPGVQHGRSGDMYVAKAAINGFLAAHDGVRIIRDGRSRNFTDDIVEQVVAAQMDGRLPLPVVAMDAAPVAAANNVQ